MAEISLNNLQNQMDSKANTTHTHVASDITDLSISSGNSVAVLQGTAAGATTLPIPSGYTRAQCKFMVSTGWSSNQANYKVTVSTTGVTTCQLFDSGGSNSWINASCTYNYIVVGVK